MCAVRSFPKLGCVRSRAGGCDLAKKLRKGNTPEPIREEEGKLGQTGSFLQIFQGVTQDREHEL